MNKKSLLSFSIISAFLVTILTACGGGSGGRQQTPISNFNCTFIGTTTAEFSWPQAIGATTISLLQSMDGTNWQEASLSLPSIGIKDTKASVIKLTPNVEYRFRLVVTGGSNAGNSNTVTARTRLADSRIDTDGPNYQGGYMVVTNQSTDSENSEPTGTLPPSSSSALNIENRIINTNTEPYMIDRHFPVPKGLTKKNLLQPSKSLVPMASVVGDKKTFWVANDYTGEDYQLSATLQYTTAQSKCEVWVENPLEITQSMAKQLADEFNNNIYQLVTNNFYTPSDVNGDSKVAILCCDIQDAYSHGSSGYIAGYFWPGDLWPQSQVAHSNQMELFCIDTFPGMRNRITDPINITRAYSTLVHEFQHMVNCNNSIVKDIGTPEGYLKTMDVWMDEGLSMAAEHIYGDFAWQNRIGYFNSSPEVARGDSLLDWQGTLGNYSLSFLFMQYVRTQLDKGNSIYKEIYSDPSQDYHSIENLIHKYIDQNMSFGQFMSDFRIAMILKDATGPYGFKGEEPFNYINTPLYTGTGTSLKGGGCIVKKVNGSFSEPAGKGTHIKYVGLNP